MTWLAWLGLAVLISAVAGLTGLQPKGTRPIAHTRMMSVARVILLVFALLCAYLAFRTGSGS